MKKEIKPLIPYKGVRKYHNFEVDYSLQRLIFTLRFGEQKLSWSVPEKYVRSYPNFRKMSEYDMWKYYSFHVLPQVKQYYEFMDWYNLN